MDRKANSDALSALSSIQPEFGSVLSTLLKTPTDEKYIESVRSLPKFGRSASPCKEYLIKKSGYSSKVGLTLDLQQTCDLVVEEYEAIKRYQKLVDSVRNLKTKNPTTIQLTRGQIQSFIDRYPATKIAMEAKTLLDQFK
jgi:hypothetical protein